MSMLRYVFVNFNSQDNGKFVDTSEKVERSVFIGHHDSGRPKHFVSWILIGLKYDTVLAVILKFSSEIHDDWTKLRRKSGENQRKSFDG